ncbi:MAG TPA: type II toxin-antitoxin system Phd/YefM family antitoxin [Thermoanaerobaculia bacterium]|nr:type II toxin-antitoxin system Phd/YefM family antitoxin [Thermoanaerobaculia bacterium]
MRKPEPTESFTVAELPAHLEDVVRKIRETGQAVVITENGQAAAVLVSPADFDWLDERRRFMAAVERGVEDERTGRLIEHEELKETLDRRFGTESAG